MTAVDAMDWRVAFSNHDAEADSEIRTAGQLEAVEVGGWLSVDLEDHDDDDTAWIYRVRVGDLVMVVARTVDSTQVTVVRGMPEVQP